MRELFREILSSEEKENHPPRLGETDAPDSRPAFFAENQQAEPTRMTAEFHKPLPLLFPLPGGEGQGEGEREHHPRMKANGNVTASTGQPLSPERRLVVGFAHTDSGERAATANGERDWLALNLCNARPHPDPLPQESENYSPRLGVADAPDSRLAFFAKNQKAETMRVTGGFHKPPPVLFPLPGGEGQGEGEREHHPRMKANGNVPVRTRQPLSPERRLAVGFGLPQHNGLHAPAQPDSARCLHPQSRSQTGAPAGWRALHLLAQMFAALLLVTTASGQNIVPPPGCLGWWPGDGNANDIQGTNNGALHNGATFSEAGKWRQAFEFDGLDDFVEIPGSQNLPITNAITVEVWILPTLTNGGRTIASKLKNETGWFFGVTDGQLRVAINGGGYGGGPSGAAFFAYTTNAIISASAWTHVAFSFDAGTQTTRFFVNGVEMGLAYYPAFAVVPGFPLDQLPIILGSSYRAFAPNAEYFAGLIDEVRIYNRALSPLEIKYLASPLLITNHPQHAFSLPGGSATFSVGADGQLPIYYQWWFNATNLLSGQTNATLTISNVQPANVGIYSVIVSNESGSLTSSNAFLTIVSPGVDDDGDGLSNELEIQWGTDPLNPDTDGDGLSDYDELFVHGTNPLLADTDGDGLPDGWEIQHGLNPRFNDAADDLDGDGLSNLAEYEWNLAHGGALDPRNRFSTSATRSDFAVVTGAGTNRFYYDRTDRLVGAEYDRGLSLAYVYDGNGNLTRQIALRHDANANGLPDLWEFLHGLTNNASAHTDTDGDGWTDWQEWKAGTNPRDANGAPNLLGNPGTQIATLQHAFTPSNFVVGVGQLDGVGAEEIVLGADGDPGTNINWLLVLTRTSSGWTTQRVDVGAFGITSIAVGQVTNRPSPGIYVGLRGTTNGSGRVMEFLNTGGVWQSNLVALATNEAAFVLGVRGQDLLVSVGMTNAPSGSLSAASFSDNWKLAFLDGHASHRGLGTLENSLPHGRSLRLLDDGGIQIGAGSTVGFGVNDGLIAHFALNGDANDSSGNGKHGTLHQADPTLNRFGAPNSALRFNGSNSHVRVPVQLVVANPFTWSAWFRPDFSSTSYAASIMNQSGDPGAQGISPAVFINWSSGPGRINFYSWDGQARHLFSQQRDQWNTNQWYNVVVACDAAGNKVVFVNGASENSATVVLGQTASNFYIGGSPAYDDWYFRGDIDDVRVYGRALSAQEVATLFAFQESMALEEPSRTKVSNWRGSSLTSGIPRSTNGISIYYTFTDDQNANGVIDFGDEFVTAEYLVSGTNATLLTLSRQPIAALNPAQSYGLASVNLLGGSNEVFFTGEPDGQVFAWTATGATNALQRQLFSAHHAGKGWHALAGVKTLHAGEALIGLRVDPVSLQRCDVILWPPQTQLPALANLPNTPPAAAVLPSAGTLGGQATLTVRLWDAEGNAATPFLQYQISGTTNWQDATLTSLNGGPYSVATRVTASPAGQNHTVVWNALADLGVDTVTNVLLRARARDMTSLGDWSLGTPFQVNTVFAGNVGNEPAFGPAQRLADGRFQLNVTGGQLGQSYVLLASTNLVDWIPIDGYVFTNPPVTIIDPDAASFRWRFYRIGPSISLLAGTLAVGDASWSSGSGVNLLLYVTPGVNYQIEASTNLVHWSVLTNFTGTLSPFPFHDPAATNFDRRFYRAVRP